MATSWFTLLPILSPCDRIVKGVRLSGAVCRSYIMGGAHCLCFPSLVQVFPDIMFAPSHARPRRHLVLLMPVNPHVPGHVRVSFGCLAELVLGISKTYDSCGSAPSYPSLRYMSVIANNNKKQHLLQRFSPPFHILHVSFFLSILAQHYYLKKNQCLYSYWPVQRDLAGLYCWNWRYGNGQGRESFIYERW